MTEDMNQTMSEAEIVRLVERFEVCHVILMNLIFILDTISASFKYSFYDFFKMDEALARSMQAQLNAEDGVTSSSPETRRFASGTSTTRLIGNGIETDMGNDQNNNNANGSTTGSSTGSSVRSSNSRIRRWTPDGSGNTLGDPVITRETSKRIYS